MATPVPNVAAAQVAAASSPPGSPPAQDEKFPFAAPTDDPEEKAKHERLRASVAAEILSSERTYVSQLETLIEVFLTPLRSLTQGTSGSEIIDAEDVDNIFSNIQIIYGFNKEFLTALEGRLETWTDAQCIGDVVSTGVTWYAGAAGMFRLVLGRIRVDLRSVEYGAITLQLLHPHQHL